jgi:hypothetical protein
MFSFLKLFMEQLFKDFIIFTSKLLYFNLKFYFIYILIFKFNRGKRIIENKGKRMQSFCEISWTKKPNLTSVSFGEKNAIYVFFKFWWCIFHVLKLV